MAEQKEVEKHANEITHSLCHMYQRITILMASFRTKHELQDSATMTAECCSENRYSEVWNVFNRPEELLNSVLG